MGTIGNHNSSSYGVTVNDKVYVTKLYNVPTTSRYHLNNSFTLTGDAIVSSNFSDSINIENWNCSQDLTINSSVMATGTINIADGKNLTVGSYKQSGGTLNIGKASTLTSNSSFANSGATNNNGTLNIDGDANVAGALNSGTVNVKGDINATASFTPSSLNLSSKLGQTLSNSAKTSVDNLTIDNKSEQGFTAGSLIEVNKSYSSNAKRIVNPQNIVLNYISSTDRFDKSSVTIGDTLTVKEGKTYTVYGDMTVNSGATVNVEKDAKLIVNGTLVCNGTLNVDGTMTVKGDAYFNSSTVSANGLVVLKGDVSVTNGTWNKPNISISGAISQSITGSEIDVGKLYIINKSNNVSVNNEINVYTLFERDCKNIRNESNIHILYDASASHASQTDKDSLTVKGKTYTVNGDMTVNSGATVNVEKDAKLIVNGTLVCNGTLNVNGTMIVKGDAYFNSSTVSANGLIVLKGDVSVTNGTWNKPNISISGAISQSITGSEIDVGKLYIINKSNNVSVNNEINVYTLFERDCKNIRNESNIHILYDASASHASQRVKNTLTVKEGTIYTVNGSLTLASSSKLVVEEGAQLVVKGEFVSNSANVTVDGDMIIRDDAYFNSSTVSANGLILFKGDVSNSSSTFNKPNLSFESKLPQIISGSDFNANSVNINNTSKIGIKFNAKINISSKLEKNSSNIVNESNLILAK